jgi:hypothetical protein
VNDAASQAAGGAVAVLVVRVLASVVRQVVVVGFTVSGGGPGMVLAHIASVGARGRARVMEQRPERPGVALSERSVLPVLALRLRLIGVAGGRRRLRGRLASRTTDGAAQLALELSHDAGATGALSRALGGN